jgi:putative heme-binding domain-containing protein
MLGQLLTRGWPVWWVLFAVLIGATPAQAQIPEWIWGQGAGQTAQPHETQFFRKSFEVGFQPVKATLTADGDDEITVFLNGWKVGQSSDWKQPVTVDVTTSMHPGRNVLALRGRNGATGPAGVWVRLEVRSPNNFGLYILTDQSWRCASHEVSGWETPEFSDQDWGKPASLGKVGVPPWGDVLALPQATPAESLTLLPGFKAELLKSATPEEGSWICMTVDPQGRFIISPEKYKTPLLRLTLSANSEVVRTETIPAPVRGAMGLLYAHDSLYVSGHGPEGPGLYRLTDQNGNDQFDPGEVRLLKKFRGDNEHGYHAVVLGPDGMIYLINGNHTGVPEGLSSNSPHQDYAEDLLLPRFWDPNGHARGVLAPGGYVLRTDPEGKHWELICGGFRNAYDLDFNPDGEMFTYDADMEWDVGCPWYRPNRINHVVNGGEYGWRSGSGKWPAYYPDSLPGILDMGLSSPTGVKFGTRSHFPPKYRRAFFACDWAYGKIFAVHLQPRGASYTATFETFLSGRPLNVVDLEFGPDGAMYFILGGWRTQSGLYKVSYIGPNVPEFAPTADEMAAAREAARQRALRHRLESFHGKKDPAAIEVAWPYLDSPDRWLRFAARLAIESQDLALWHERARNETRTEASINALLALTRKGDPNMQSEVLAGLKRLSQRNLTEAQSLEALRVLQLAFIRLGDPDPATPEKTARVLLHFFPASSDVVNRELCRVLVYLQCPSVIDPALQLMARASTQETAMDYAYELSFLKTGWNPERRRRYFGWFQIAQRDYTGGNSFDKYLVHIRNEAMKALTETERSALADVLAPAVKEVPTPPLPRPFLKEWRIEDLVPLLSQVERNRSFARGKEAFAAAQCVQCHRIGKTGGTIGPDLTGVGARFSRRDLLEQILLPSKVISDRYRTIMFVKRDGEEITGTISDETEDRVVVVNPTTQQAQEVLKKEIQSRETSTISAMPEGLLNGLNQEEILDLLAYLETDGQKEATCFLNGR